VSIQIPNPRPRRKKSDTPYDRTKIGGKPSHLKGLHEVAGHDSVKEAVDVYDNRKKRKESLDQEGELVTPRSKLSSINGDELSSGEKGSLEVS